MSNLSQRIVLPPGVNVQWADPGSRACTRPDKIGRYVHEAAAQMALADRVKNRVPGWQGLQAYACECGYWHLGHPTAEDLARAAAAAEDDKDDALTEAVLAALEDGDAWDQLLEQHDVRLVLVELRELAADADVQLARARGAEVDPDWLATTRRRHWLLVERAKYTRHRARRLAAAGAVQSMQPQQAVEYAQAEARRAELALEQQKEKRRTVEAANDLDARAGQHREAARRLALAVHRHQSRTRRPREQDRELWDALAQVLVPYRKETISVGELVAEGVWCETEAERAAYRHQVRVRRAKGWAQAGE